MGGIDREAAPTTTQAAIRRVLLGMAWLLLMLMIVDFLFTTYQKYRHADGAAYDLFTSRREWLWAHLAGGTMTVLLGPWQFLAWLRNTWPRVHRWNGRLYLCGLLLACTGAAGLIATTPAGSGIQIAFAATELAWLFTAQRGYRAIRKKLICAHRRWMVRNYLITLVFVTFRAVMMIPGVMTLGPPSTVIATLLWSSWVLPLLVYQLGLAAAGWRSRRTSARLGRRPAIAAR